MLDSNSTLKTTSGKQSFNVKSDKKFFQVLTPKVLGAKNQEIFFREKWPQGGTTGGGATRTSPQ